MRAINLAQADGALRPDAIALLMAFAAYPEDEASREQAFMIWAHERERFLAAGEPFGPSAVSRMIAGSLEKRAGQVVLAGYVAIVLTLLDAFGHRMSLKRAARIVSDLVYRDPQGRVHWMSHKDGAPQPRSAKASGDVDDIERYFREYRAAAHILGAFVSMSEWIDLEFKFGYDDAPEFEACFLKTVLELEARLRLAPNFQDWNLWSVATTLPAEVWALPSLMPTDEMLEAILGPEHYEAVVVSHNLPSNEETAEERVG